MTTEVWLRNPITYIREVVEVRHDLIAWDRGLLIKRNVDPSSFLSLYFDQSMSYRQLVIGFDGAQELRRGDTLEKPFAVYPVWQYGDSIELLEEMLENPVGSDRVACSDQSVKRRLRPVYGQEHRVVITAVPSAGTGPGRKILRKLEELQEEYPEAIIHIHGLYSYRVMFGMNFASVDVDARTTAQKGKVYLPNGKEVSYERAAVTPQWVTLCGYKPKDLEIPRNRCMYNIRSALWAAEFYKTNIKFKSTGSVPVDPHEPSGRVSLAEVTSTMPYRGKATEGDKFLCDLCTLKDTCKYFREGAVCSVPGTEPAKFANLFKSRDSDTIIDALGTLLSKQAQRLEDGLKDEELADELDPEVSKLMNSLFKNGTQLAKLVNPALAGGPKVGIMVGSGSQVSLGTSPGQLTAAIVAELESKGIPRSDITPEMIASVLDPHARERAAIETTATVVSRDED